MKCQRCGEEYSKDELEYLELGDTQGYHGKGWYCSDCARMVRELAFQVEDEDVYDIEDD